MFPPLAAFAAGSLTPHDLNEVIGGVGETYGRLVRQKIGQKKRKMTSYLRYISDGKHVSFNSTTIPLVACSPSLMTACLMDDSRRDINKYIEEMKASEIYQNILDIEKQHRRKEAKESEALFWNALVAMSYTKELYAHVSHTTFRVSDIQYKHHMTFSAVLYLNDGFSYYDVILRWQPELHYFLPFNLDGLPTSTPNGIAFRYQGPKDLWKTKQALAEKFPEDIVESIMYYYVYV